MQSDAAGIKKYFFWVVLLSAFNMVLMAGVLCYVLLKTTSQNPSAAVQVTRSPDLAGPSCSANATVSSQVPEPSKDLTNPSDLLKVISMSKATTDLLDQSVSLKTAERLYEAKEYFKACYVYDRLKKNILGKTPADECLKDYLHLKMALCLQKTQEQELMSELFTRALQSRSPVVRSLANYNLSFIEMHNRQYLAARSRAYRALGLMEAVVGTIPSQMESDTYFLAAEAMSRYLIRLYNVKESLAGRSWAYDTPLIQIPLFDQKLLKKFLIAGMEEVNAGALNPILRRDQDLDEGVQWFAVCMDAPLEEMLWKYASDTDIHLAWADLDVETRRRAVTLYMPNATGRYIAEVSSGGAGLVWRYDGQRAVLYDPEVYTDFESHKKVLASEAIATWQRFLLRYRTDQRAPNAHYILGILYSLLGQDVTALGEFRLLSSQYPHNTLAPFALLNASKIKANLKDYAGARDDLNELLTQYPECKVVDEATLHLAEITMHSKLYSEAADLFMKVYQFNLNEDSRLQACYGAGECAFRQGNYILALEWLERAVKMNKDPDDPRQASAFFLIGQSCTELKEYSQASAALKAALNGNLDTLENVQIILKLVEAEMQQERFVSALEILEKIDEQRLNQDLSCDVILVRARLLQEIDLTEAAITLLRRRIEFIVEANLRARLTIALARCYFNSGDYRVAEKELTDAIYDLESPTETRAAAFLLARTVYSLGDKQKAQDICMNILSNSPAEGAVRKETFEFLGKIYTENKEYEQAALAFAGLWRPES